MKEYLKSYNDVLSELSSDKGGITSSKAQQLISQHGYNELKEGKQKTLIQRFLSELADPMIIILIIAAAISGITALYSGESFADVIIILAVVVINAILGVFQESKAEKAIAALSKIAAATSKVIRDGKQVVLPSRELVPGDIIVLEAGDAVPADARLIECASLKIEESALTGESVPVNKTADVLSADANGDVPLGDRSNMVYMGSSVSYGRGRAVVTGTGMNTEMGKIASVLASTVDDETPLQLKLNQLSKILSFLVLGISIVIFAIDLFRLYPNFNGEALLDTFMVAVSLAVAAIPEGLAAVVTIVLSIGVTNMSNRNAVIRRLTAVETLGCTQIICSDKTGTLTQNKMTVVDDYGDDRELMATAFTLCTDAVLPKGKTVSEGDPTQTAVVDHAAKLGLLKYELEEKMPRIGEIPFDSGRKLMTTVHREGSRFVQYTTGAPDVVISRCTHIMLGGKAVEFTDELRHTVHSKNKNFADQALRVLAAAARWYDTEPVSYEPDVMENGLVFLGLEGMIDPIRPEVRDSINMCREAGIRPIMITGDHKDTAVAIAKQLGILQPGQEAITGAQLDEISDEDFRRTIETYSVYARVQPEHKVRIVNGWKSRGNITAMTGDGVNDAPSIKNADIGIGMGITGTDVTKNVADMVLADDNFATIVSAVEEGRRIYDNIRKSIQFLLSSNLSEVLAIFFATILGFTVLKPVHLLWINLITDCFPALALGMEKGEDDNMHHPPRKADEGIFADGMAFDIAFQGALITALTLFSYFVGHHAYSGVWEIAESSHGMTMAFITLSFIETFHSLNLRSRHASIFSIRWQNTWLWGAMLLSIVLTTLVVFVPFLQNAFSFTPVTFSQYLTAIAIALIIIPVIEIVKLIKRLAAK